MGRCDEYIPYFSSLANCLFGFMCVCVVFIDGDLLPTGHVMFVHDSVLIICQFDGCIDDYCAIILIFDYVLVFLVV